MKGFGTFRSHFRAVFDRCRSSLFHYLFAAGEYGLHVQRFCPVSFILFGYSENYVHFFNFFFLIAAEMSSHSQVNNIQQPGYLSMT